MVNPRPTHQGLLQVDSPHQVLADDLAHVGVGLDDLPLLLFGEPLHPGFFEFLEIGSTSTGNGPRPTGRKGTGVTADTLA